jgi:AAA+ ATPase superfamily predicted ATPase
MKDFRHASGMLDNNCFYGRDDEISILINNIKLRQHTALIGQRQFGKTALVHKAIERYPIKVLKADVDLTRKATLHEAAHFLLNNFMLENFGIKRFLVMAQMDFAGLMTQAFSFMGDVKKIKLKDYEIELREINLLASETASVKSIDLFVSTVEFIDSVATKMEKPVVLFIDEFQRIAQFPEVKTNDVLWPLRSAIQNCKSTTLIVAGSKPSVLKNLISEPDSAFFNSFIINDIHGIKEEDFLAHFNEVCDTYKVINIPKASKFVYDIFSGMPSYLSLFGRKLFDETKLKKKLETEMYFKVLEETFYESYTAFRLFEEKINEIPNGLIVYKEIFAGENPKMEAVRLSGTTAANIQNVTISKMLENGFIVRKGHGEYEVVDSALGYYMAEITSQEQFKNIYEDKVLSSMLGINP